MKFFVKIKPHKADEKETIREEAKPFEIENPLYNSGFTLTVYRQKTAEEK